MARPPGIKALVQCQLTRPAHTRPDRDQTTGRRNGLDAATYGPDSSRKGGAYLPIGELARYRVRARAYFTRRSSRCKVQRGYRND